MYIGSEEILRRIREEKLLENCDLKNVQGAGVDLEIEKLFEIASNASLGREKRELPELREIIPKVVRKTRGLPKEDWQTRQLPYGNLAIARGRVFRLAPKKYYLCTTKERVNMPSDLIAFILPRSTLFRSGVSLRTAVVDPGYVGALTLGIKNESEHEFTLEKNSRIAQIVFSKVYGKAENYSGKYQGGRIS